MRELTYLVAVSLDGRIAGPDGDVSAFPVEGDHVDALVREWPDVLPTHVHAPLRVVADRARFDTVLMGWRTYAVGLPAVDAPYAHLRQVVFSRTRSARDVPSSVELTGEDPVQVVRRLKAEPGTGIWLCGGGALAASLVDEIDRLVLKVNPVVLGAGTPLLDLPAGPPRRFRLERSTAYDSGVVVQEYARG